jgi:hypothetical protein
VQTVNTNYDCKVVQARLTAVVRHSSDAARVASLKILIGLDINGVRFHQVCIHVLSAN